MPDFRSRFHALLRPERQPIVAELPAVGGDQTTVVIRLYDPIDSWGEWWGVSAKEMATVLDDLPADVETIELRINSPGGEVFDGIAILNLLRNHPAKVVAVVEGLAASAASFIACGADEVVMAPNSELMIHDAWGLCVGNAQDLRDLAEDLDRLSNNIASIYAAKAGGDLADWRAAMERETWYSAEEAVAAGLADRVDAKAPAADDAKARLDLSIFNFAGRGASPGPRSSATPPSPRPRPGQRGASAMELSEIREALGLADDTSDEDVLTAALDRLTAPPDPAPAPAPLPAPLPDGVVAIDAAQLEQLRTAALAGETARAEQLAQHRVTVVAAAVADGRIAPARRDHWVAQLEADPGAEQVLTGLEKGLIPVNELGGETGDLDTEFTEYERIYGKEVKV